MSDSGKNWATLAQSVAPFRVLAYNHNKAKTSKRRKIERNTFAADGSMTSVCCVSCDLRADVQPKIRKEARDFFSLLAVLNASGL